MNQLQEDESQMQSGLLSETYSCEGKPEDAEAKSEQLGCELIGKN